MAPTTVLFDVDGTLVDSNFHHVVAWHHAFLDVGQEVPCWRILGLIGRSGDELVNALLGDERADEHGSAVKKLHTTYFLDSASLIRRLPGTRELLEAIAERGWQSVLATSAGEEELRALRSALDCEELITAVTSAADAERAKPHPDIVATALERVGATPAESIFLGDAVWDVHAARRAGVPAAAVLSGGTPREKLVDAGGRTGLRRTARCACAHRAVRSTRFRGDGCQRAELSPDAPTAARPAVTCAHCLRRAYP